VHRGEGECLEYGQNSLEIKNHEERVKRKINCVYSREYQIPDQPKIN
jgi:hypothetical protein